MPDTEPLAKRYRSSALLFYAVACVALLACWAADGGVVCALVAVAYAVVGVVFSVLAARERAARTARLRRPQEDTDVLS